METTVIFPAIPFVNATNKLERTYNKIIKRLDGIKKFNAEYSEYTVDVEPYSDYCIFVD